MNESLTDKLRKLRLSGLAETLEVRLHEARGNSLTHGEFLELILQDELLVRDQRKIARRVKGATFRDLKSLEEFDWGFNPTIKKNQIYDLATGRFLKERRDVLFCSPPGTGKSHLVQGIGYHLIRMALKSSQPLCEQRLSIAVTPLLSREAAGSPAYRNELTSSYGTRRSHRCAVSRM